MPVSEKIEFRKVRDFGDVINVTFAFLRQNLSVLGKSLLLIVGPVALLGGLSSIGFWNEMSFDPAASEDAMIEELNYGVFGLSYMFFLLMSMLSYILAITVVNGYMLLYEADGGAGITLQDVVQVVKARFWDMIVTAIFAFVLYMASVMIFVIPLSLIALNASTATTVVAGLLLFVFMIAWMVGFFYFIVLAGLLFPARMHEKNRLLGALARCRYLIKGNYGHTLAVLVVSTLLTMVLGLVFSVPSYLIAFMGGLHAISEGDSAWMQYPLMLVSVVGTLGSSLLYAIPAAAMGMQYFSLVEQKEKAGLMQRIDELDPEVDDLF